MPGMDHRTTTVERHIDATPDGVWRVLSDGWVYPTWVVGASRMRHVDDHWPSVGAELRHSFGNWPILIDDRTEVLRSEPPRLLALRAHGWPVGAAEVLIEIEPDRGGSLVRIREDATQGPGALVPRPLRQAAIVPRNRESLQRLAFIAEGRSSTEHATPRGPQ